MAMDIKNHCLLSHCILTDFYGGVPYCRSDFLGGAMLKDLLNLIGDKETYSLAELSELTGLGEAMLMTQMDYLENAGYIRKVNLNRGCSSSCHSCKGCDTINVSPKIWERIC